MVNVYELILIIFESGYPCNNCFQISIFLLLFSHTLWHIGTENVALIVGLGEACRLAKTEADSLLLHMLSLKLLFITLLKEKLKDFKVSYLSFLFFGHIYWSAVWVLIASTKYIH